LVIGTVSAISLSLLYLLLDTAGYNHPVRCCCLKLALMLM
jgi:hypothetical protein